MSTDRVIVQHGIAPALNSELVRLASKLKAGDPTNDSTAQSSCLFSEASARNVCSMIEEAKQLGAEVLVGDGNQDHALVQPHIVKGAKPGMRLWNRESFGPVFTLTEVDTVDEAIDLANNSDYSLVASLWSKSATVDLAGRLRAGLCLTDVRRLSRAETFFPGAVLVNGATVHTEPQFGHGGLGSVYFQDVCTT
jgi:acyl-CoA reductase-like NAD-dependent aldehyde dehydrogenase